MKLNKKIVALNVLASIVFTDGVVAGIKGVRAPGNSPTGSSGNSQSISTSSITTKAEKEKAEKVTAANESTCTGDMDSLKYFPQSLFRQITRDGEDLDIEVRGNKVLVKIPPIINECGNFVPELKQNKDTKSISILMKLINKDQKEVTHKEFEDCLRNIKIGTPETSIYENGELNHKDIPGKMYSENVYSMAFDFDKKADAKKTVSVSFAYPKAYSDPKNGYPELHEFDNRVKVPGEPCMRAEKIVDKNSQDKLETLYVNKGVDVLIQEINEVCKSGDAQKIAAARNSLGNLDALQDVADKIRAEMDVGYLNAMKPVIDGIYKDLGKIEDKLGRDREKLDEKTAKKEIAKYAELLNKLDKEFLNKAIARVDALMLKREKLDEDSDEIKLIDEEIKKLNDEIGAFSKRNASALDGIYAAMEKFALTDSAKTIEDIRLKSDLYSRVYVGSHDEKRGKAITFEEAKEQQAEKLARFDKALVDWNDKYQVSKGSYYPIRKTEKEREAVANRMNKRWYDFEKKATSDYNNYCTYGMTGGVKDPIKCKEFMSTYQAKRAAEEKRRTKDLYYIKGRNAKLEAMGKSYNEYTTKLGNREIADASKYEPGSSYSGHEDSFYDRFPGYYGPQTSTAYDPSMFQMGGMQQSLMLGQGQQQMMMQGQGQGQYPMQQGGWPSTP